MNTTDKIKELLGIEDDIDLNDLFEKLSTYRNSVHPDKNPSYMSESFNAKFSEANNLLTELKQIIVDKANSQSSDTDLAIYSEKIKKHESMFEVITLQDKLTKMSSKLEKLNDKASEFNREKKEDLKNEIKEKCSNVLSKYEISKKDNLIFRTAFSITTLILILKQVGIVESIFLSKNPGLDFIFNVAIIIVYGIIVGNYIIRLMLNRNINLIISGIETTKTKCSFVEFTREKGPNFDEKVILEFIEKYVSSNKLVAYMSKLWFYSNYELIVDLCKDKLLSYLFRYEVIEYGYTTYGIHFFSFKNNNSWSKDTNLKIHMDDLFAAQ